MYVCMCLGVTLAGNCALEGQLECMCVCVCTRDGVVRICVYVGMYVYAYISST
jgi:hypothetical protein